MFDSRRSFIAKSEPFVPLTVLSPDWLISNAIRLCQMQYLALNGWKRSHEKHIPEF